MTGDGTDERPTPAQGEQPGQTPKRRRRRRRGGRKRPQTTAGQPKAGTGDPSPAPKAGIAPTEKPAKDGAPSGSGSGAPSGTKAVSKTGGGRQSRRRSTGKKKGERPPEAAKLPWTREISAGGVVYRRADDGGIEVVLASRRTRRGDLAWGLAKGGIEEGESREEAALREVREETGLTAEIEADLGDTKYMYVWADVRIRKTVHFFLMRFTGGDVDDRDDEMEEIRWFPLERALKRAAYRGERDVLMRAAELLK
jgi:8-oxo-dGTP pyrophosphatase MutT (NUDIX family)